MKNRRYCLLGLLGIGLWASGCNRAQPLPSDYFGGEFVCYDDTARFFDCATGRTYLLDRSGAYPEIVANYEQMRPAPHGSHVLPRRDPARSRLVERPGTDGRP